MYIHVGGVGRDAVVWGGGLKAEILRVQFPMMSYIRPKYGPTSKKNKKLEYFLRGKGVLCVPPMLPHSYAVSKTGTHKILESSVFVVGLDR